ncbi:sugar ABC transporter substrate-binding protein [Burkholderia thailandensis]|uniref:Sugar ABC transporter, periplasmic sugar-binding protein n=1 Tax=Burkholderia thailandensis (strain ATCC 700388 / DSM 13276 / CCUG 48851 / CIP 106301 / E264) TaxID=271848 RepID=Q2T4U4_BURTA|nr:sugar ABC transporter substrate-binding protein [Burkholderia thailandensis]ABC34962.1 sugar ABC transporter, periplasmic sugar-binding protein [Burkholderia thailandensis E264]AHI75310.1 periplasmic binding s and sugar binding domain of LacI family protein [Burkholderia thailandensis 2002721723]AHI80627.1 periplasmic binding s and sugar binding domain of LacI family protein [Burkholderia thailandensis E444]AIP27899.1 periplasmic binding s and sugar binding domain of LacI family protein [Bur
MTWINRGRALAGCAALAWALAAAPAGADTGKVGLDLPLLTSPFWQSYNNYLLHYAKDMQIDALAPVNSNGDPAQQITDMNNLLNLGAKGIVVGPLDSAAIGRALDAAAARNVPVVAVDVAPTQGKVAMVVRADNRAYGEKACKYLGEHVQKGKVVQIMGDLASVNGRDRSEAFRACMKGYPHLQVLEIPAAWKGDVAATALDSLLTANPDVKGIYMQAGGVYLSPTLQTLRRKQMLYPAGGAKHVVIVSNDGIPQEYEAIRRGDIDATVSQPADLYARYGLFYIKAALAGQTFKPGPTDHGSVIVQRAPGILEDQLPAPLVTKANVDDKSLWGNTIK